MSTSSEGRAGLQGVCQGDVVICLALTELFFFFLLVPVNQNSFWRDPKSSRCPCEKHVVAKFFWGNISCLGLWLWHTVDVRHKAFLSPLHLNPSVLQRGAPALEPWRMWWGCSSPSCSCESPLISPKFLCLSAFVPTDMEGFLWDLFGCFGLLLLFGDFFEVVFVGQKRESHTRSCRICVVPRALRARPEADKD